MSELDEQKTCGWCGRRAELKAEIREPNPPTHPLRGMTRERICGDCLEAVRGVRSKRITEGRRRARARAAVEH